MNEVTATFDLKGTDGSTISSFPVTPTDTDTNNTTPRPKSNRMQWINSMNNNSGRSAPIMVIMDNMDNTRSPSVHSTTPIIITPSQSDTNLSNLNNIINKQNNSINDEHESEVDDDDDDDELDDDIDDTPLLKSPNKDFLNNNNPFPLKLNLKSPRIHTKNSNNKRVHKSTPHPSYKRPKPCNITISSIQHNNNNIEIERDRNDIPNTPIPQTNNNNNNNNNKPAKIKTLDENMSDNDSDSSFDNYLFADTHSYKLSNKSSKNIHARNKNNVSRTVHKNRPKNLKNICVNSPISNGLLSPIVTHTDTPISTNNSQIGYKIKSYHTYQTRESSLLDHEDEYDPPRGSLQLTPHPRSNGSNHNNHAHNIGIKNTISSPIVNGQIICSIVEEEDMNNNDESGCEIDSEYINNYLNQNHSNKSHANNTPFSIQRDRSRSIAIHDMEPIEPSNIWTDTDSISTMNTVPSTMNTMHTMTDITIAYRPKNTKKRKVLSQHLTLSDIKNKKSHEHNGSSSYFFPSPKTMYQELHGHTHGHNGHTNKPKLSLATYSSDTDEGSIIPIKPSPNSSINSSINSSNSLNSIDTSNTNTLNTMDTSINSYNSLNSIDTFDSNYSYKYDKYANNNTGRNVKIIRRKKKNNQYRRKIHKSKYPLDFEPKLKMLSEMDTLSTSRSHSDDMTDMTDMTDDNNNNDQQHTRSSNNDGTLHVLSSYNNDQRSSNNDTMHVLSSYIPCDISDSADLAYQEYIGTEYGVNTNGESYRQSTESYRQSNISNISSSNDNSNDHDNYYSNVDYDYYNNNSNHSNNNNNNNNNRNDFNINNNNNNNNRNVFNINNKMNSQYTNVNSDHWNKYIYNQQWQKALQGAYLRGFNKGYSMGVQFKLSNGLPHH